MLGSIELIVGLCPGSTTMTGPVPGGTTAGGGTAFAVVFVGVGVGAVLVVGVAGLLVREADVSGGVAVGASDVADVAGAGGVLVRAV